MAKETSGEVFRFQWRREENNHSHKATKSSLKAAVISNGTGIALSKFKGKSRTPVRYRGKTDPQRSTRPELREAGGVKRSRRRSESFYRDYEIRPQGVFYTYQRPKPSDQAVIWPVCSADDKNEKIMKAINDDANETLQKRIDAEIANLLRKG